MSGRELHAESKRPEVLMIRTLCGGAEDGSIRAEAIRLLARYEWRDPLCAAIYLSISKLPDDPNKLRDLLPVRLTRMGFPDVDWSEFLDLPVLSRDEAIELMQQMLRDQRV